MILFAMSCASSFAVEVSSVLLFFDDTAVKGFSSRIAPIRRTTSDQEIVWISAYETINIQLTWSSTDTYIRDLEQMGVEIIYFK